MLPDIFILVNKDFQMFFRMV